MERALSAGTLYRNSAHPLDQIFQICGNKRNVQVLGVINRPYSTTEHGSSMLHATTIRNKWQPQICYPANPALSVQVVTFQRPNPSQMQYMSLEPISLALLDNSYETKKSPTISFPRDEEEERERVRVARLVEKLKLHTVICHSPTEKEKGLCTILAQINCCAEFSDLLSKNCPLIGSSRTRRRSVGERVIESAQSLYTHVAISLWNIMLLYLYPTLRQSFLICLITARVMAEFILEILEWQPPQRFWESELESSNSSSISPSHSRERRLALKDVSATFQQIHLRLEQFSYYPMQYLLLRRRQRTWASIPTAHDDYIRFYNSLWLVANDVIIGVAVGSYIIESHRFTAAALASLLNATTISGLKNMITWLMGWPAGLKLNGELAEFLGALFLWVIECWDQAVTTVIAPHLPTMLYVIGFSSFAGASLPLAILSDLLSLLTLHIYNFYIASARIFKWQLTVIYSLFQLFRGKKRNVLRHRIDSCDYDLDQLLLGTILFTLLFFLLPTVAVFYLTFAFARVSIILLQAALDTCLACLNHFPLFALMLRLKDPKRLPGGIRFTVTTQPQRSENAIRHNIARTWLTRSTDGKSNHLPSRALGSPTRPHPNDNDEDYVSISYVTLSSIPLSLRQIFAQYLHLVSRIRKHYLSFEVVFRLGTGRFVPPLSRDEMYSLQYSMLPRRRVSVGGIWRGLVHGDVDDSSDH